ncbi:MAG: DUF6340 family protein [Bacteroidales bacterium]|nr:DUF6340 family protein [Bacteroidales bacterium]
MKNLRNLLILLAILPMTASCGLTYETLSVQLMKPSASTLDLKNRSMSVFMAYKNSQDSTICCQVLTGFVEKMSEEYSKPVTLFSMPFDAAADYTNRDTLASYITMANNDVVFLTYPNGKYDAVTGVMDYTLLVYDSMVKDDIVNSLSHLKVSAINPSATTDNLMLNFKPTWKGASFKILYFEGNSDWTSAMQQAIAGDWTNAIDAWIELLSKSTALERRMAAEYNIAVGCYLLEDLPLAEKWLDQAIADCGQNVTPSYMQYLKTLIKQGDR